SHLTSNSDHAGTPEAFKPYVIGGARGGGGSNYTGSLSGTVAVAPALNKCTTITCAASDPCHVAGTCDPATGQCSNPAAPDGTACNDHNACTLSDACHAGACAGGPAPDCDDGNVCTSDACDPTRGCVHVNRGGSPATITFNEVPSLTPHSGASGVMVTNQ